MYYIKIQDNAFFVGERCLGEILEIVVTGCGCVNGQIAQYTFRLEDNNEVLIQVPVNSDLDRFLGITMLRSIWIWCSENKLKAEISNYARLRQRGCK